MLLTVNVVRLTDIVCAIDDMLPSVRAHGEVIQAQEWIGHYSEHWWQKPWLFQLSTIKHYGHQTSNCC